MNEDHTVAHVLEILAQILKGLGSAVMRLVGLLVVLVFFVAWANLLNGQPLLYNPLVTGSMPVLVPLVICWPALHALFSARSVGGAKFAWFTLMLLFSWIAYLPFLIITQSKVTKKSQ